MKIPSKKDEAKARLRLQQMEALLRTMADEVLAYGVSGTLSCRLEQIDAAVATLRSTAHVVMAARRSCGGEK